MLMLTIGSIDRYGYCGRDHHPVPADEGTTVPVLSVSSFDVFSDDLDQPVLPDSDAPADVVAALRKAGPSASALHCFTCARPDGSLVEVMEHEVAKIALDEAFTAGSYLVRS